MESKGLFIHQCFPWLKFYVDVEFPLDENNIWCSFYRGEHILLFLVQTVSRQITEQRAYIPKGVDCHPNKRRAQAAASAAKGDTNFPDHDLEPPKFARQALELIMKEWRAIKSMVLTGSKFADK